MDTRDDVKRRAGWMGGRRAHTACGTHSEHTGQWTEKKSDVQKCSWPGEHAGHYSNRARGAGPMHSRGWHGASRP